MAADGASSRVSHRGGARPMGRLLDPPGRLRWPLIPRVFRSANNVPAYLDRVEGPGAIAARGGRHHAAVLRSLPRDNFPGTGYPGTIYS